MKTNKQAIRKAVIAACLVLSGIIIFNILGYILNLKYLNVFTAANEINKYEVRCLLLLDAMPELGVNSPEKAASLWAKGLMTRNAALQYSVLTSDLKDQYFRQLEQKYPNWVTAFSSPWVDRYEIINTQQVNAHQYRYQLRFHLQTSTEYVGNYDATLTIEHDKDFWRISTIDTPPELYPYTGYQPPQT